MRISIFSSFKVIVKTSIFALALSGSINAAHAEYLRACTDYDHEHRLEAGRVAYQDFCAQDHVYSSSFAPMRHRHYTKRKYGRYEANVARHAHPSQIFNHPASGMKHKQETADVGVHYGQSRFRPMPQLHYAPAQVISPLHRQDPLPEWRVQ